jgi:hypothetical protein
MALSALMAAGGNGTRTSVPVLAVRRVSVPSLILSRRGVTASVIRSPL